MNAVAEPSVLLSPEPLYQLAMGFAYSRSFLAAHRLGLFEALSREAKSAPVVAAECGLSLEPAQTLLDACASLRLLDREGTCYRTSELARRFLVKGQGPYLGHFFDHFNDHMLPAWNYLEETVRTGRPQMDRIIGQENDPFFQALDRDPRDLETFMWTMEEHSLLEGDALAHQYDFSSHRELLDVAGGTGAMSVAILKRYPHLRSTVVERPSACAMGSHFIARHGLSEKIRMTEGDMFLALPAGADIALLSGTLHNWGPREAAAILNQCARALSTGGVLLISEQVLDDGPAASPIGPLCSLNMMVLMGGREYSRSDYEKMLDVAGFQLREIRPTGGLRQLLIAKRR